MIAAIAKRDASTSAEAESAARGPQRRHSTGVWTEEMALASKP